MSRARGFTLLEVLVALSVLAIVLVSIFKLTGSALQQHQVGESRLVLALTAEAALNAERLEPGSARDAVWPAGVMDPDLQSPVRSDHPVLLLSGELDPVTPPSWAEEAMGGLSNSRHVVAPGQGHGAAIRGCLPRLMADFVDAEGFDEVDFECVERLRAPPFLLNFSGPAP
mgnify:CR=1 FL=1